ncbi:MAG: alkaline phytoceramidase [Pseudomonadota bacterium]
MKSIPPWSIPLALGALVLFAALLPALPQPQGYHRFADQREILGLPNGLNVISNLSFLLTGVLGLVVLRIQPPGNRLVRQAYGLFFLALVAVGTGSAWYHLAPDNARLLWDRLPIAAGLAALLGAVLAETGLARRWTLPALVALGLAATLWWGLSPLWGAETLWPYLAFQAGCMAALLTLLPHAPAPRMLLAALVLYGTAVGVEWMDAKLFAWSGGALSGHTLKHLLASASVLLIALRLAVSRGIH